MRLVKFEFRSAEAAILIKKTVVIINGCTYRRCTSNVKRSGLTKRHDYMFPDKNEMRPGSCLSETPVPVLLVGFALFTIYGI